jgi:3-hydroxybutyryl-CoA dehydrogenase
MSDNGRMEIRTAGVVGLGTMGAGIVEVFSRAGLDVVAVEIDDAMLTAGRGRLETSLGRAVEKGRLTEADRDAQLARITFTTSRADLGAADLVTEAVPERLDIKAALFADLDEICPAGAVLATNTSSLPVTQIAMSTTRPDRVVGMHFFNPAPVMKLVEVITTPVTDHAVRDAVARAATDCGKTVVTVADRAGFVANALLFGYLNAAARAVETGQAAADDLDAALVAACGLPMGPLTLLDLIGLDVSLDVLEAIYDETRDQRYAASPMLRRMVVAGQLGRKSGRGYYDYSRRPPTLSMSPPTTEAGPPLAADRVVAVAGDTASAVVKALGLVAVTADEVGDADVIAIDGGSRIGTAELASRVARHARPNAVLAVATTDEAPVAVIAAGTGRAQNVVGLHLPLAPRPGVVEVVASTRSNPQAAATVADVVRAAGLTALVCRDRPGHVVDMLVLPHLGDAVRMAGDFYAGAADIDAAMRLGCGYADGPFAMIDAIGADNLRSGLLHLAAATHLPSLAPAPLLDDLAAFGAWG